MHRYKTLVVLIFLKLESTNIVYHNSYPDVSFLKISHQMLCYVTGTRSKNIEILYFDNTPALSPVYTCNEVTMALVYDIEVSSLAVM